jgi:hypothetical protein
MTNIKTTTISVTGLMPYTKYVYAFTGIGANWPTFLSNPSGVFSTNNSTGKTIKTNVTFCLSTGICPSGSDGVLDYSINQCRNTSTSLYSNLNLVLKEYDTQEEIFNDNIEVNCLDCLPKIGVSSPFAVTISSSNNYPIAISATGLIAKQTYNYTFSHIDANWPTTFATSSGTFLAKDSTETILSTLTFCPNTGVCENAGQTVEPYTLDNNCVLGNTNPFSKFKFVLSPTSCSLDSVETDPITVTCSNCLPRVSISSPANATLAANGNNLYTLNHTLTGLRQNENYSYVYNGLSSNWPTIITPVSGSFTASGATHSLSARMMFCYPKNICPSGTEGLFDYSLDTLPEKLLKSNLLSTSLTLTVSPESCEIPSKTSNVFTLNCSGCLPCFSYSSINFADTPELNLSSVCCTGMKTITVDVNGAVPGDAYSYKFDSESNAISFMPSTGLIYFGANGAGEINTIMTTQLIGAQQAVINCELTHVDSLIKTMDFLSVKCSGECIV